jgi:hypothetical protein
MLLRVTSHVKTLTVSKHCKIKNPYLLLLVFGLKIGYIFEVMNRALSSVG